MLFNTYLCINVLISILINVNVRINIFIQGSHRQGKTGNLNMSGKSGKVREF